MALNRLDIFASVTGARTARRLIVGIGSGAREAQGSVRLLRRALGSLAGGAILHRLRQYSDSFTLITNRLAIVTKGSSELGAVTRELFKVANATRTSFQLTAEIYTRTALATRELGRSQAETIQFTETLNKAVILSGAGVLEAQNAMIQLSQGLSSNTLRGDELRSVLEQLPIVADAIAKHFNVTRGELRALGEENKITAKDILDAFKEAREEIDERFLKVVPTIAQSFTILRNNFVALIGEFNKSTGIMTGVSSAIIWMAENLRSLVRAALTAAAAVGIALAVKALGALTVAIATNPLGAFVVLLGTAVLAVAAFGDQMTLSAASSATVFDVLAVATSGALEGIKGFLEVALEYFTGIKGALTDIDFVGVILDTANWADEMIGVFAGTQAAIGVIWRGLPGIMREAWQTNANLVIDAVERTLNSLIDGINAFPEAMRQMVTTSVDFLKNLPKLIGEKLVEGFNTILENTRTFVDKIKEFLGQLPGTTEDATGQTITLLTNVFTGAEREFERFSATVAKTLNEGIKLDRITPADLGALEITGFNAGEIYVEAYNRAIREGLARGSATEFLAKVEARALERVRQERQRAEDLAEAAAKLGATGVDKTKGPGQNAAFLRLIERLKNEGEALKLSNREMEIRQKLLRLNRPLTRKGIDLLEEGNSALRAQVEGLLRQNRSLKLQQDILESIAGPQLDYLDGVKALEQLYLRGSVSLGDYVNSMKELRLEMLDTSRVGVAGLERGLLRLELSYLDMAANIDQAVTSTFRTLEDTMVDFFRAGEFNAKAMVDAIIAELARLLVVQSILGPIAGALGAVIPTGGGVVGGVPASTGAGVTTPTAVAHGGGLVGGSSMPHRDVPLSLFQNARRYHNGGPILGPGEVPIIAQEGERVLKRGDSSGRVTVNVINNTGTNAEVKETRRANGQIDLELVLEEAVAKSIRSPGGSVQKAMAQTFGSRPRPVNR